MAIYEFEKLIDEGNSDEKEPKKDLNGNVVYIGENNTMIVKKWFAVGSHKGMADG